MGGGGEKGCKEKGGWRRGGVGDGGVWDGGVEVESVGCRWKSTIGDQLGMGGWWRNNKMC